MNTKPNINVRTIQVPIFNDSQHSLWFAAYDVPERMVNGVLCFDHIGDRFGEPVEIDTGATQNLILQVPPLASKSQLNRGVQIYWAKTRPDVLPRAIAELEPLMCRNIERQPVFRRRFWPYRVQVVPRRLALPAGIPIDH